MDTHLKVNIKTGHYPRNESITIPFVSVNAGSDADAQCE